VISLTFTFSGIPVFVRAAFFRICADYTLRGPESSVVAVYTAYGWQLGARKCREFEARGPVLLRAVGPEGVTEHLGPFELVRASEGALFANGRCLGTYCGIRGALPGHEWREVALLMAS
jgi:hypothetical protein